MSGIVTVPYLRRRFWIAQLVLVGTLAASAGVAVLALKGQEERSEYAIALQHLGDSVDQLEEQLDHLAFYSRRGAASRDGARDAYRALLTRFHRIVVASRGATEPPGNAGTRSHDHTAGVHGRHSTDGAPLLEHNHLDVGPMPESLARMWVPGSGSPSAGPSTNLEYVLDRMLYLTWGVVSGEGTLSPAEADRIQTIKATIAALVSPRLDEITSVLERDMHSLIDRALVSLLALLAVATSVAMLNVFVIFRPLERAVMAAQARLEIERDRALEAAAAKRNFLSIMSHELRTPMNGVLGFSGLLLASDLTREQQRQVEIIRSSGKTLLALVNDILDFSRMEAGGLELADEIFALEEVIGEVLGLVQAGVTGKDIETAVYIDPRMPERVRGDPERVRQILINLVGKAVKFTERGTVAVEARWLAPADGKKPTVELAVSDTGPGIPRDQQARIFERFTQAEGAGRSARKGTGLGLAICRELSDRMGGDIRVESAPGQGATFRVRLRLAAAEDEDRREAGATAALVPGMRALIVDNNPVAAGLVRRQLDGWGVKADIAARSEDVWHLLDAASAEGSPHAVVLVDADLRDADPSALARQISEDPRFARVRVVLMAAQGSERARAAAALGVDVIDAAPVMPSNLLDALQRLAGDEAEKGRDAAGGTEGQVAPPRILLTEDHAVSQQLVVRILEGAGYLVDAVGDGAAAVEAVAEGEHDLVLMDIRMPELDGIEATRRIRALPGVAASLPILTLTANASPEDIAEYRKTGMVDVIPKPIEAGRLIAAVRRALRAGDQRPRSSGGTDTRGSERFSPEDAADGLAPTR